ncbi:hypothetical protein B0J18DRAFT_439728, partial [Chaetomium sp. MPI-SDFR-AT-0129]
MRISPHALRPCKQCVRAKQACDKKRPCKRCTTKGLQCVPQYRSPAAAEKPFVSMQGDWYSYAPNAHSFRVIPNIRNPALHKEWSEGDSVRVPRQSSPSRLQYSFPSDVGAHWPPTTESASTYRRTESPTINANCPGHGKQTVPNQLYPGSTEQRSPHRLLTPIAGHVGDGSQSVDDAALDRRHNGDAWQRSRVDCITAIIKHQQQLIGEHDCTTSIGRLAYLSGLFCSVPQPIPQVFFVRIRSLDLPSLELTGLISAEGSGFVGLLQTIGEIEEDEDGWTWKPNTRLRTRRQNQPKWDALLLMLLCAIFPHHNIHDSPCSDARRLLPLLSPLLCKETVQVTPVESHRLIVWISVAAAELDGGNAAKSLRGTISLKEFVPEYFQHRRQALADQERVVMEAM